VLQKLSGFKSASHGDVPFNNASLSMSSNEEDASESSPKSRHSSDEKEENSEKNEANESTGRISHRRKFEYAFRKKKKIEKDVIVCEAESDCVIQSTKPIFIHSKTQGLRTGVIKAKSFTANVPDHDSDNEEDMSCINVRDIKDLNHAMKLDVDSIAITGARNRKDVEEARFILGPKNHIKVITKIQNAAVIQKFSFIFCL
jgi:hypothetical protein